jgi:hypothetical protein
MNITINGLIKAGFVWTNNVSWSLHPEYDGLTIADDDGLWGAYYHGIFIAHYFDMKDIIILKTIMQQETYYDEPIEF